MDIVIITDDKGYYLGVTQSHLLYLWLGNWKRDLKLWGNISVDDDSASIGENLFKFHFESL